MYDTGQAAELKIAEDLLSLRNGPQSVELHVEDGRLVIKLPGYRAVARIKPNVRIRLEISGTRPGDVFVTLAAYGSIDNKIPPGQCGVDGVDD